MRAKAKDLIFISLIKRDGSGVIPVGENRQAELEALLDSDNWRLERLSITEDTWIAFNMSVYVVKKKKP